MKELFWKCSFRNSILKVRDLSNEEEILKNTRTFLPSTVGV